MDADGDFEIVTVTIDLTDIQENAQGAVLAAGYVDDAMADEDAWLSTFA